MGAMDIQFKDCHVVEVLKRIEKFKPDTLLSPWSGDLHHDHEVVARITASASRRVPRVLMGQINYYLKEFSFPISLSPSAIHRRRKLAR